MWLNPWASVNRFKWNALTEQVDDAVIVAGVQLDQIFKEQQETGIYHSVV